MGNRGPKPKPIALKLLGGNPGNRPAQATGTGRARKGRPEKPADLTGEASREWDRIVPELEAAGWLAVVDRAGLSAYCFAWAQMVWAESVMQAEGAIIREPVQTSKGEIIPGFEKLKAHPAVKIHAEASGRVRSYLAEFGLTPASRSRLEGDAGGAIDKPVNKITELAARVQAARNGGY